MTTVYLSPIGNGAQFFDANGNPLSGGQLFTYVAGSSTPQATYTTNTGSVQNANPIILGADGRPPQEIWLTSGVYKFILQDANNITIFSLDNISGMASPLSTLNPGTTMWGGTAGGSANALSITTAVPVSTYSLGQLFTFQAGALPNTGATTINVDGIGNLAVQAAGLALIGNEILAGKFYSVLVDSLSTCQLNMMSCAFGFNTQTTGAINGVNTTFTLPFSPLYAVIGKNQLPLAASEYTLVGATITTTLPPSMTDTIQAVFCIY